MASSACIGRQPKPNRTALPEAGPRRPCSPSAQHHRRVSGGVEEIEAIANFGPSRATDRLAGDAEGAGTLVLACTRNLQVVYFTTFTRQEACSWLGCNSKTLFA